MKPKFSFIDFPKVCRVCLNEKSNMLSLIETGINDQIEACFSYKLSIEKDLPNAICKDCYECVCNSCALKNLIKTSEQTLLKLLALKTKQQPNKNQLNDNITLVENNFELVEEKHNILIQENEPEDNLIDIIELADNLNDDGSLIGSPTNMQNFLEPVGIEPPSESVIVKKIITSHIITNKQPPPKPKLTESNELMRLVGDSTNKETPIEESIFSDDYLNPFRCKICNKIFRYSDTLQSHLDKMHFKHELENYEKLRWKNKYTCYKCKKVVGTQKQLQIHMKTHGPRERIKCTYCDKWLYRRSLRVHVGKAHLKTWKKLLCNICNTAVTNLRQHTDMKHSQDVVPCDKCEKTFTNIHTLKCHQRRKHMDNILNVECEVCSKVLADQSSLKRHLTVHSNERNYLCNLCSKSFKEKSTLRRHKLNLHMEKTISCNLCDERFATHSHLRRHVQKQHENFRPFKCDQCPKAFFDRLTLTDHINTHTGARPYICQECGDSFSQKAALFTHKKLKHLRAKQNDNDQKIKMESHELVQLNDDNLNNQVIIENNGIVIVESSQLIMDENNVGHLIENNDENKQATAAQQIFISNQNDSNLTTTDILHHNGQTYTIKFIS